MIQQDARRILELDETIKALEVKRAEVAERSTIAKLLRFITEYEPIGTSDLAGEIGTIERFRKEGSLAQYRGMATLDNSSGEHQGSKQPKHVNTRANALAETVFDALVRYLTTNAMGPKNSLSSQFTWLKKFGGTASTAASVTSDVAVGPVNRVAVGVSCPVFDSPSRETALLFCPFTVAKISD